jgi:hypothetical protein
MARNTGRGSRVAAADPRARQFVEAKKRGGDFDWWRREHTWWRRLWRAVTGHV